MPTREIETEYRVNFLWPIHRPIDFSFNETDEDWQQLIRRFQFSIFILYISKINYEGKQQIERFRIKNLIFPSCYGALCVCEFDKIVHVPNCWSSWNRSFGCWNPIEQLVVPSFLILTFRHFLHVTPFPFANCDQNIRKVCSLTYPFQWFLVHQTYVEQIRRGLHQWEEETCIEFNENPNATDRLEFIRDENCYSYLGNTEGTQQISIGNECEDIGSLLHEIGHALGLNHEHQRLDRDNYARVDTKSSYCEIQNFNKLIVFNNSFELPYDFGSIMHYDTFACSALPFYKTITTHNSRYQHTIGQRSLSFLDVKHINLLYCEDTCADTKTECFNGGYPNPRACNQCKCPSGLGGPSCLNVEETEGCGGELEATNQWQSLAFNERRRCVWRVSAQRNSRVRLILDEAKYLSDEACTSFVEIKHSADFQTTGFRSCCDEHDVETISDGNHVLIIHDARELNWHGVFSLPYIHTETRLLTIRI